MRPGYGVLVLLSAAGLILEGFVQPVTAQEPNPWQGPPTAVEQIVWPDSSTIDGRYVVPHRATWRVYRHDASSDDPTLLGFWSDAFSETTEGGRELLRFQQVYVGADGGYLNSALNLLDRASLRPIRIEQHSGTGLEAVVRYEGNVVSGEFLPQAESARRSFADTLPRQVWDFASTGWLLFGQDLHEGMTLGIPYYPLRPGAGPIEWEILTVHGRERVDGGPLGSIETWRITNAQSWTYWAIQEPPYVVRLEIESPNGSRRAWEFDDLVVFRDGGWGNLRFRLPSAP